MDKIAIVTANLGNFDKSFEAVGQKLPDNLTCDLHVLTDEVFLPRSKAMTPRMQARIVKMFMPDFAPDYDYYIWVDSSMKITSPKFVQWMLEQLGDEDIAVFKHPDRNTVQEEADYLKHRLAIKCPYITPRYENELIDEQLDVVNPAAELYASTAFIYRSNNFTEDAMKEWWHHTSRYHIIDQLSLPHALLRCQVKVIPDNYLKTEYMEYVRNK